LLPVPIQLEPSVLEAVKVSTLQRILMLLVVAAVAELVNSMLVVAVVLAAYYQVHLQLFRDPYIPSLSVAAVQPMQMVEYLLLVVWEYRALKLVAALEE
jgi:hypothetical protein